MNKVNSFFLFCSGVNIALLQKSRTENNKYAGIGATVLFTGLFATIAATYALFVISDNMLLAGIIGLLWGLMIFDLDRLIVGSTRKTDNFKRDSLMILPRVIMAIFISMVIATPLELKIFEKEINQELRLIDETYQNKQKERISLKIDSLRVIQKLVIHSLEQGLREKELARNNMMVIAQVEADGTGGSGLRNLGPIYSLKKKNADRLQAEYLLLKTRNQAIINKTIRKIDSLNTYQSESYAHIKPKDADGLAARMVALDQMSQRESKIMVVKLFITLLFITIELSPIIIKLMMERGPYDYIIKDFDTRIIRKHS
jgi:hypothetical protein